MSLPTELVHVIALHLQWDTTSLYRLSLLDVQTYQLLLPIRFRRVQLKSSLAVLSFCSAISSSRDPGLYVQTLRIGKRPGLFNPKPWLFHEELGSALRAALLRMPRLSNLSLISTTSGFNKCFDRLDLPFSLQRLEICCINSEPFFSLLRSQSSIKELWLIVMHSQNLNDFYNFFAVNKDILPHLSTVAAPELLLDVTMVDRPVSSIVFDYRGWPFPGFWRRLEGENYGPIHSLGIISFGSYVFKSCLDPWLCLVGNPPVHGIDGNIRQLTVFDPSMVPRFALSFQQ
ncbi:hypothetical protein FRC08_017234 [Ceratobasidium sp. 394]|nr:hypothetical protein FRC08_017234 [Ceratobasidium sp. 394]